MKKEACILIIGLLILAVFVAFLEEQKSIPDEIAIKASCTHLNIAKANHSAHEKMFIDCVSNGSKRTATHEDDEHEIISQCQAAAERTYPVDPHVFAMYGKPAVDAAYARGCGQ